MKELIEALTIFAKYIPDERHPTLCEHDVLSVMCDPDGVSAEDLERLEVLGFDPSKECPGTFVSFRYGSA